jgi:hypothetical protein
VIKARKGTKPILDVERSPSVFCTNEKNFVGLKERGGVFPRVLKREDGRCVGHTSLHRKLGKIFSFGKMSGGCVLI